MTDALRTVTPLPCPFCAVVPLTYDLGKKVCCETSGCALEDRVTFVVAWNTRTAVLDPAPQLHPMEHIAKDLLANQVELSQSAAKVLNDNRFNLYLDSTPPTPEAGEGYAVTRQRCPVCDASWPASTRHICPRAGEVTPREWRSDPQVQEARAIAIDLLGDPKQHGPDWIQALDAYADAVAAAVGGGR